jgi:beta-phosphoglucomutase
MKAVIFDCDGVLVDTEPLHYHAFQTVLGPLGIGHSYEHYLEHYIGFDDRDAFLEAFREAGRELDGEVLAQLIHAKEKVLHGMIGQGIPSFPGVVALVRDLVAHRIPLAVASGALRREVEAFVHGLGLTGCFSVIVAADDVQRSKPDPETYLKALDQLRASLVPEALDPGSCLAIEDTPAGIQSAKGAGLHVIGVTNSFPMDQLGGADHIVASLAELSFSRLVQLIRKQESPQKR